MTVIRRDQFAALTAAHAQALQSRQTPESVIPLEQHPAYRAGLDAARRHYFNEIAQGFQDVFDADRFLQAHVVEIVNAALDKALGKLAPQDLIAACGATALKESAEAQAVVVHVAACDHEAAREILAAHVPHARVELDPLLQAGELVLETHRGRQHVGARAQINRLKANLQASVP